MAPNHSNPRMRCLTLRQVRWLYLLVALLFGILLTTYLTETGREVLDTVGLTLPPFGPGEDENGKGGRPRPGGYYEEERPQGVQTGQPHKAQTGPNPGFTVPPGVRVIGLVFYGRRELVKVLDCYLKVPLSPSFLPLSPAPSTQQLTCGTEESQRQRRSPR